MYKIANENIVITEQDKPPEGVVKFDQTFIWSDRQDVASGSYVMVNKNHGRQIDLLYLIDVSHHIKE
jgi:hypothetical protein